MGKTITLEVSDIVFERAERMAAQVGVPIETILAKWLERGTTWDTSAEYPVYTPFGTEQLAEAMMKYLEAQQNYDTRHTKIESDHMANRG